MSVGATYTQLVLFDGTNVNDQKWFGKIKKLSETPRSCDFWIFCDETNAFIEKSLEFVKNSKVRLFKSPDPVDQILKTLHEKSLTYSYILVVCDKNASYTCKLNKIMKKHKHIYIIPIDPSCVNLEDITHKVDYHMVKAQEVNLQHHSKRKYDLYTNEQENKPPHLKKLSDNKDSSLADQYDNDLYCLLCDKSFHTKDAQNKHIKARHPDATSENDDDE